MNTSSSTTNGSSSTMNAYSSTMYEHSSTMFGYSSTMYVYPSTINSFLSPSSPSTTTMNVSASASVNVSTIPADSVVMTSSEMHTGLTTRISTTNGNVTTKHTQPSGITTRRLTSTRMVTTKSCSQYPFGLTQGKYKKKQSPKTSELEVVNLNVLVQIPYRTTLHHTVCFRKCMHALGLYLFKGMFLVSLYSEGLFLEEGYYWWVLYCFWVPENLLALGPGSVYHAMVNDLNRFNKTIYIFPCVGVL